MFDLRERRKELGLTLEEVGNMVGVGKSTVRKWETGDINNMGRSNIAKLADALQISPLHILKDDYQESSANFHYVYSKLNSNNKERVYNYASRLLDEQSNNDQSNIIHIHSKLSAGTGIIDLDPGHVDEMTYDAEIPKHDLAFLVAGDSMQPVFEDGEVVFVEKTHDIRNGQIIAVQINEEAYIKKAYKEENQLRLVSLNTKYEDIYASEDDDIRIVGRVIL